ncbi:MAG: hypothetical protein RIG77_24330 [Cyclobacteriaceae bacterium]
MSSTCPHCNNLYHEYEGVYSKFRYCKQCLDLRRELKPHQEWCKEPNIQKVIKKYESGTLHAHLQCMNCGFKVKGPISKKKLDIQSLPEYNESLAEKVYAKIYEESTRLHNRANDIRKKKFFNEYSNYLESEEWKEKRKLVLKRDNHLCQSCLTNKATQVHHKNYKYLYNEPLFELVSVCKPCHDRITLIDRETQK